MATIPDSKLFIAGTGHVHFGAPDAPPPVIDNYKFGDEATYGGLLWVGDTSRENVVEFETDGGDVTFKGTWDRPNVKEVREDESVTGVINSVNLGRDTFELAFPGGEYDEETKSYSAFGSRGASVRSCLIVMEDADDRAALYLPKVSIKGSFPVFDTEEFMEVPLNLALLTSDVDGRYFRWFEPRTYVPAAG